MWPFKLATTSYIYPDHLLPNVMKLAPYFDEVELVLFESEGQNNLPEEEEIRALKDFSLNQGLNFNIHLPIDIFLGDRSEEIRTRGLSVLKTVIERTHPLHPSTYTLHLSLRDRNGKDEEDISSWRRRLIHSLDKVEGCGIAPEKISIETLGYPFEWVEGIVSDFGFSICLDLGHILLYGQDLQRYLDRYLSRTTIIHFHGFQNGMDHLGLDHLDGKTVGFVLSNLKNYTGVLSIEVFSLNDLKNSLNVLEERWIRRE